MEQLPNLVRDRLQARLDPNHPSADMLTAFAEGALSTNERGPVLDHLSRCSECREVLSIAMPESSPLSVSVQPAKASRSPWLMLRWTALVACVVIVGAAVTLRLKSNHSQFSTATLKTQTAQLEATPQPSPSTSIRAELTTKSDQFEAKPEKKLLTLDKVKSAPHSGEVLKVAPSLPVQAQAASAVGSGAGFGTKRQSSPSGDLSFTGSAEKIAESAPVDEALAKQVPAAPQPTVPAGGTGIVSENKSAAASVQPSPSNSAVEVVSDAWSADTKEESAPLQKLSTARAQTPPTPAAVAVGAQANLNPNSLADTAATASGVRILKDLSQARWSLSNDGLPQRSLDSGKTWEKIQVDHSSGFRALSAIALDVWVGGLGGVLYYSSDVGMHWTRINAICDGAPLTADIARLEFTDAQHGKLTSANRQVWITADAGKTWERW